MVQFHICGYTARHGEADALAGREASDRDAVTGMPHGTLHQMDTLERDALDGDGGGGE
jgi:hypothetical protein